MQSHLQPAITNLSTLVPALPIDAMRRTFVEAFALPAVERTPQTRRGTDRRVAADRRKLHAEWPERLEQRAGGRRSSDRGKQDRDAWGTRASRSDGGKSTANGSTPLRKGLIIDVYA